MKKNMTNNNNTATNPRLSVVLTTDEFAQLNQLVQYMIESKQFITPTSLTVSKSSFVRSLILDAIKKNFKHLANSSVVGGLNVGGQ